MDATRPKQDRREKMRKVYQIRGSGAGGYYQGIDLWESEERYGSGARAIDLMGYIGHDDEGNANHEYFTVAVDRVDDLVEALTALRDEIVADEMTAANTSREGQNGVPNAVWDRMSEEDRRRATGES